MSFLSCEEMLAAASSQKISLSEAILRSDLAESRLTEAHSRETMHHLWQVMQATSRDYDPAQRSRSGEADEEAICDALYVAAGFGQVIAARATLAGAEGGCQAEVGAASAMAAAALCHLKGGAPEQCAAAAAMALGNLLGLVCDPVAGLVEVPCIKRNVVGAVNAVSCANMALAGVDYAIPCDEVIDAMGRVGSLLSPDLRETGQGGLAATPTGVRIAQTLAEQG